MTGEGGEYGGKKGEGQDEHDEGEDPRKETKNLIDEIEHEKQEQEADEQQEQNWRKEADDCVKEAIKERDRQEEEERKAREEEEEEYRQFQEQGREERAESSEDDNLSEWEKDVIDNLEKYGADPDELKELWREQFAKDVEDELGQSEAEDSLDEQDEGEPDDQSGLGKTEDTESYHDSGSGQMLATKTESSESSESNAEAEPAEETQSSETEPADSPGSSTSKEMPGANQPSSETEEATQASESESPEGHQQHSDEDIEEPKTLENTSKKTGDTEYHETETMSKAGSENYVDTEVNQNETKNESNTDSTNEPEVSSEKSQGTGEEIETSDRESEETDSENELTPEDADWQERLNRMFNKLPEDLQEAIKEHIEEKVEDEDDFEELAKKHGLEDLLEDEEAMDEVRQFLRYKKARKLNPEASAEDIAEEIGIDSEQAENWDDRKHWPEAIKKVLNLEGYRVLDNLARGSRELDYPFDLEEYEDYLERNPRLEFEDPMAPFEEWDNEARAWIEIMKMRRKCKIKIKLRNGRERYHREQIEDLSRKYGISKERIVSWLRGETVPPLLRKIGKRKLVQKNRERTSFDTGDLIGTRRIFDQVLSRNQNIRLDKRFETWYRDVMIYFEVEMKAAMGEVDQTRFAQEHGISVWKLRKLRRERPYLLNRLERNELRRIYSEINGGSPEVSIESMEDLKRLLDIHEDLRLDDYDNCEIFFEMRRLRAKGWTYTKLSNKFKMSRTKINNWLNEYPPKPIPKLRQAEETRIIKSWAEEKAFKLRISTDYEKEQQRKLRRGVLPDNGKIDNLKALENAVRNLVSQLDPSSERVLYADVEYDDEQFLLNLEKLNQLAKEILGRKVRLALVDNRLYIWAPNEYRFRLINLYSDFYFYFPNAGSFAKFLGQIKTDLDRSVSLDLGRTHLENLISQMCDTEERVSFRNEKGKRLFRIKGKHLHLLLDIRGLALSDLEGVISKVSGYSGYGGIMNPIFPSGEQLALVLARMYAAISCDGSISKNGEVRYWEQHLDRIARVIENLRMLGDIDINPRYEKDSLYCCRMPTIIGTILQRMGLQPGNKTRHNPQLNREFLDAVSWEVARAFTEDTIPEDGTVRSGRISCTHSVMLPPNIGKEEKDLIKNHGKKEGDRWRLPVGKLRKLMNSKDVKTAQAAKRLYQCVMANPSNQIKDEKQIVESLGVNLVDSPVSVHFHKKSGNVTISWRWTTAGEIEAMKLAIIAPPNDVKKRAVLRKWLLESLEETEKMYQYLCSHGVDVKQWWLGK